MTQETPVVQKPGLWAWARIPLEFIGGFFLFTILVGALILFFPRTPENPNAFFFLWMATLVLLVVRVFWNFFQMWERKAPYFWLTFLLMSWAGIVVFGILVAISAPNLQRLLARALQIEGKTALARIVGAEGAVLQEFKKYSLDPGIMGIEAESGARFYTVGFPDACAAMAGIPPEKARSQWANSPFAKGREQEISDFFRSIKDCPDPSQGFEAYAVGVIRPGGTLDVWRINQNKELVNLHSGMDANPISGR